MEHFFSKNIQTLRKEKGLTQAEIAPLLGLKRNTYANYESEHTQPDIVTLIRIASFFGISLDNLINLELKDVKNVTIEKESKNVKRIVKNNVKNEPQNPDKWEINRSYLDLDGHHNNNVFDFESKAAAGEAIALFDKDKTRVQPNLYLPHLGPGIHIRVPISGDSMHSTIKDSDKIVGTLLTDISELRQGYIYAILDKHDGLVCKRVYLEGKNTIELVSDNEIYKPYKRHLKDIASMFRVREVHSTDLRPYFDDIRREMRQLSTRMADMERLLSK